jgi:hypothetical protein
MVKFFQRFTKAIIWVMIASFLLSVIVPSAMMFIGR